MQEIIYCLEHGPGASERREESLDVVFPHMEFSLPEICSGLEAIKTLPVPRHIKTHLPVSYFRRQLESQSTCPKFVVVMRNPKDILTSYYRFLKLWPGDLAFPKDWSYFFGMFQEKRLEYGDCFDHMLGWWSYRNHSNVLVVTYEDMKRDSKGIIMKVGEFLGSPNYSDDDLEMIVFETSFNKMKTRPIEKSFQPDFVGSPEGFFRKGQVGVWREFFQAEQQDYVDERIRSELNSAGIRFDWLIEITTDFLWHRLDYICHCINKDCFHWSKLLTESYLFFEIMLYFCFL